MQVAGNEISFDVKLYDTRPQEVNTILRIYSITTRLHCLCQLRTARNRSERET